MPFILLLTQTSTVNRGPNHHHHLVLQVAPETLTETRARCAALTARLTPEGEARHQVLIAIEEAVQNVIRHGYRPEELPGRLELTAWREGGDLILELRDYAKPADLARIRPRSWDPARPGGLGLQLIRAAMDDVEYAHAPDGDGNILLMRKHLG